MRELYVICNKWTKTYHPNTYEAGACFDALSGEFELKYTDKSGQYVYLTLSEAIAQGFEECAECKKSR